MRAEEIKGLMEAYSHVYETPEVLSEEVVEEDVEQLMERGAPTDPKARAAYDAQVAKNRAALGNTLLYGNAAGKKPEAPVTRNRNVRGGGTIKPPAAAAPAKPKVSNIPPSEGTGRGGPSDIRRGSTPTPSAPAAKPAATAAPKPAATSTPKPTTPAAPAKPAGSAMDQWAKANPKLAAAKAERDRTRGTSATTNPLMKDMKSSMPAPKSPAPSTASTGFGLAKKGVNLAAGVDIFDLVKGHLLDEGYADSEEGAMVIMVNMSEEWRESILESYGVQLDELSDRTVGSAVNARIAATGAAIDRENKNRTPQNVRDTERAADKESSIKRAAARRRKRMQAEDLELDEAQRARENPEDHDEKEKRKYEPVRGERTPMPPRGDKRREDFEKWYAKQMGR